jgi:hypothetical protein
MAARRAALVEILSFEGCPNREAARALVERVTGELGVTAEIRVVDVVDDESAERLRFLGSPSVRVDGRDVEPGADERPAFALSCRVYRSDRGVTGLPDEAWIRSALETATT